MTGVQTCALPISFPNPAKRVALEVQVLEEVKLEGGLLRRKLSYQSDATDRVMAYLFFPEAASKSKLPAVLCLHQTTKLGKAESAGLAPNPLQYALDLARRHGAKTVDLTSRPSREAANRMYQRIGFQARETNVYRYDL